MAKKKELLAINYSKLHYLKKSGVDEFRKVPDEEPFPPVKVTGGDPGPMDILLPAYLAWDLRISSLLLAELAQEKSGRYSEGKEAPHISVAASTGAILTAFATIEGYVNETITIHAEHNRRRGPINLFRKGLMEQSILTRLESVFIELGIDVEWDKEPFQSLKLLATVRNAIVHHEGETGIPFSEGYFPKKSLKAVVTKIRSPYEDDPLSPHHWHTHILTPNGAVWAVNTMLDIFDLIDKALEQESEA